MQSALNAPQLWNEDAAIAYIEARLWPDGPVCPHCGAIDQATRLEGQKHSSRLVEMPRVPQALYGAHGDCVRVRATSRCTSGFRRST